jgi:hypothetical protein
VEPRRRVASTPERRMRLPECIKMACDALYLPRWRRMATLWQSIKGRAPELTSMLLSVVVMAGFVPYERSISSAM